METERNYLNRRAGEERAAATRAANPRARDAHLTMAARYEARLRDSSNGVRSAPQPAVP